MYYILLDEVQLLSEFEEVLNSLLHIDNADVYVTGSNSKFLSKDIITEFRGRGDEIHIFPLTFKEFMQVYEGDIYHGWADYMLYGGLPLIAAMKTEEQKVSYLTRLFEETYLKDIIERHHIEKNRNWKIWSIFLHQRSALLRMFRKSNLHSRVCCDQKSAEIPYVSTWNTWKMLLLSIRPTGIM